MARQLKDYEPQFLPAVCDPTSSLLFICEREIVTGSYFTGSLALNEVIGGKPLMRPVTM